MNRLLTFLFVVVTSLQMSAQIRGNNIVVTVEPDHKDWNYKTGEKALFVVEVRKSGTLIDGVSIDYAAGPEMYQDIKKSLVLKNGTHILSGTMKQPGFYRVDVTAHVDGKDYKQACGVAFSPEKLQPSTIMPADFSDFWTKAIAEARKVDLNPTKRLLPERCTKDVNVYEVSFNNIKNGWRTYGILSVPVKEGHGISVTMEQKVYDDVFNGALMNYWNWGMDKREDSYYYRVVLGCIRALDYIEQYTPWNGKELGVTGSSQGGFLSIATAGLDKRITYYAPVHAALCDHTNSLKGVACGWPHYFYWNKGKGQEKRDFPLL